MAQISTSKLMALARRGASGAKKRGGRRRPHKNDLKRYGKAAALGTVAGLAVSVPLTLLGRHYNRPELIEAGQRVGSIVASKVGGPIGVTGYQITDAVFDRVVVYQGSGVSGTREVYL